LVLAGVGVLALALLLPFGGSPSRATPVPPPDLERLLKKARCDGAYQMLLRQIKVPEDADEYTDFHDLGYRTRREYAGHKDLPAGWWVYAAPYWYIWRDLAEIRRAPRPWGPEQAVGPPDTHDAGDRPTAWASATPDGSEEWLLLEYAEPVLPVSLHIYETFNPGAVYRVTVYKLDGTEVEAWRGKDPTPVGTDKDVSEIPLRLDFKVNRVKVFLDSPGVPGWNEIDAVELRDRARKSHWAVAADASSTYAPPHPFSQEEINSHRIRRLEREVRQLRKLVEELKRNKK
jgi:hypothetical protein